MDKGRRADRMQPLLLPVTEDGRKRLVVGRDQMHRDGLGRQHRRRQRSVHLDLGEQDGALRLHPHDAEQARL